MVRLSAARINKTALRATAYAMVRHDITLLRMPLQYKERVPCGIIMNITSSPFSFCIRARTKIHRVKKRRKEGRQKKLITLLNSECQDHFELYNV